MFWAMLTNDSETAIEILQVLQSLEASQAMDFANRRGEETILRKAVGGPTFSTFLHLICKWSSFRQRCKRLDLEHSNQKMYCLFLLAMFVFLVPDFLFFAFGRPPKVLVGFSEHPWLFGPYFPWEPCALTNPWLFGQCSWVPTEREWAFMHSRSMTPPLWRHPGKPTCQSEQLDLDPNLRLGKERTLRNSENKITDLQNTSPNQGGKACKVVTLGGLRA